MNAFDAAKYLGIMSDQREPISGTGSFVLEKTCNAHTHAPTGRTGIEHSCAHAQPWGTRRYA